MFPKLFLFKILRLGFFCLLVLRLLTRLPRTSSFIAGINPLYKGGLISETILFKLDLQLDLPKQIQIEGVTYMAPKRNSETTFIVKTFKSAYWVVLVSSNSNIFIHVFFSF